MMDSWRLTSERHSTVGIYPLNSGQQRRFESGPQQTPAILATCFSAASTAGIAEPTALPTANQ